jgi:hypothetical protein
MDLFNNDDFDEEQDDPYANDDEFSNRSVSPELGDKRSRSPTEDISGQPQQKAFKITASRGKPKAGDFDPATQALLKVVIACYRGHLCGENPYPEPMVALTWAKLAWNQACRLCESHIQYTAELLKLVCRFLLISLLRLSLIQYRSLIATVTFVARSKLEFMNSSQKRMAFKVAQSQQPLLRTSSLPGNLKKAFHLFTV